MKRDMDLIRAILTATEYLPVTGRPELVSSVAGYDSEAFARHAELLKEAGWVQATIAHAWGSVPVRADVERLLGPGHDFLDSIRDEHVWSATKASLASTVGTASLEVVKAIAVAASMRASGLG